MIVIFGGGDIATNGIIPVTGGTVVDCDVTDLRAVTRVVQSAQPEVVINCAGISSPFTIKDSDPDQWASEIFVNLVGSYNVAKAAVDNNVKTLIFIASVAGLYGKPNHSGYSASKGGVISLVQSLGMEGHDAYAISPGRVNTSMREKDYPGENPQTRLHPLEVGTVVAEILAGQHEPGDNLIVRKIGYDTFNLTDRGEPWRDYLKVGEPPRC